ncbi:MAG: fixJ [Sphingomonas bacterium]|uniref:response regulator transcription factor n=1 Tax=Sphingomonas bacterium TaxID=1895847 RepID=UPI0026168590|nr:LuxR C-terminal-related transcriptional regulator [Sphingomonas bacterium]MDB5704363.1 fixJ [Sphingomonas bacterium]
MRLEPGSRATNLVRRFPPTPKTSGSAKGLAAPDGIEADASPKVDVALALPDRPAACELLAQQCQSRIDGLSPRQRDVLVGLVAGHSNKQIARILGISPRTIEIYRADMMDRLKARTLAHVLHIAFVAGLAPADTISLGNG